MGLCGALWGSPSPPGWLRCDRLTPQPPWQVLKILLHTCAQGSPQFVLQLKRNAAFIREAAGNGGEERGSGGSERLCGVLEGSARPCREPSAAPAPVAAPEAELCPSLSFCPVLGAKNLPKTSPRALQRSLGPQTPSMATA